MRLIAALLFVTVTAPAYGQTKEATLDLNGLGWGALDTPKSVETDGDFSTREWLVRSVDTNRFRVVAERDDKLCVGQWFSAGNAGPFAVSFDLQRVGVLHKLVVRTVFSNTVNVYGLDTPACSQ